VGAEVNELIARRNGEFIADVSVSVGLRANIMPPASPACQSQ